MNTQLPTLNRQGRSILDAAVTGLGFARHPMVSRAGNRFTLVDSAGNAKPMALMDQAGRIYVDVVIFDASPHPNRMFFAGPYEQDSSSPPDCFSDNGTGASTQARNPQAPTCAACPQAKWGSRVTQQGTEVPACQTGKKLAVLILGDPSGIAYEFRVPPGSFSGQPAQDPMEGGWTWYVKAMKGYGKELFDVVTRITFVPNTMGVMVFKPVAVVEGNADLVNKINDAWTKDVSSELIGAKDRPIDPASFGAEQKAVNVEATPRQALPIPPQPQGMQGAGQTAAPGTQQPFGGQMGQQFPFAATAAVGQQLPGQLAGVQQNVGPSPSDPPKRTRRTKAQIEADNAAKAAQAGAPPNMFQAPAPFVPPADNVGDIPPFLRRTPPAPAPAAPQAMPGGLAQPQTPDADLQAKLAAAFNLPTGGGNG